MMDRHPQTARRSHWVEGLSLAVLTVKPLLGGSLPQGSDLTGPKNILPHFQILFLPPLP